MAKVASGDVGRSETRNVKKGERLPDRECLAENFMG